MAVQNRYLQLPVCADSSLCEFLLQGLKGNFGGVIRIAQMGQADVAKIATDESYIRVHASVALQFFFVFALASALIVLMAAIQTGRHEREIESSLLRALSAHTNQLYRVHVLEFTLMGGLIGFFSAAFATVAGWAISVYFFDIDFHFSPTVWAYSLISACLVLTIAGTLVSRRVYNVSPMKILRS